VSTIAARRQRLPREESAGLLGREQGFVPFAHIRRPHSSLLLHRVDRPMHETL
jgi:hypothetical protein